MIPIQDLLNRIRWDAEFGKGDFILGYYDRVRHEVVRVPFSRVHFTPGEHFAFEAVEDDGTLHTVPFHRVREVWRNGELIWHREAHLPDTETD